MTARPIVDEITDHAVATLSEWVGGYTAPNEEGTQFRLTVEHIGGDYVRVHVEDHGPIPEDPRSVMVGLTVVDLTAQQHDPAGHGFRQRRILDDIVRERDAQDALFGVQDLPDGTGGPVMVDRANEARVQCDYLFSVGAGDFRAVFLEEVYEAMAESDPTKLRAELVQAVAAGVKWLEAIDRREGR